MKHLTVGVAGHVDHGKTALVRALTGMETDRLKEEQQRGMSIALGFAHRAFPEGKIDFIDVPGHERFVQTMISGASGIDFVLLAIAANERVKPQTREHLALAQLLGVEAGIVVITKGDVLPDTESRVSTEREVREYLADSFLRDAPMLWTSTVNGEGIEAVCQTLNRHLAEAPAREGKPDFYLPVDRVFSMAGHGTVVTGTLRRGQLRLGQRVEVVPRGRVAEVRGLEVHGRAVEEALPGWRTAVNLRGVKQDDIERGNALSPQGTLRPTRLLDAQLNLLPDISPLRRGQTVRLHVGTCDMVARVHPIGSNEGDTERACFVQFRLNADLCVPVHERFVIRSLSPAATLGGGIIVDAAPLRHRLGDTVAAARVKTLLTGTAREKVRAKLQEAGAAGREVAQLSRELDVTESEIAKALADLSAIVRGTVAVDRDAFITLQGRVVELVNQHHAAHPLQRGMAREELRRRMPRTLPSVHFSFLLDQLARQSALVIEGGMVRAEGFYPEANLTPVERAIIGEMEDRYRKTGLRPPSFAEIIGTDRRRKHLYQFLRESGRVVELTERASNRAVTFHPSALDDAAHKLQLALTGRIGMTVSEINKLLNTTRKYSIALLEHFDTQGITRRVGDARVLGDNITMEGGDTTYGAETSPADRDGQLCGLSG